MIEARAAIRMMAGVGGNGSLSSLSSRSIGSASAISGTSAFENNNVRFLKSYTGIFNQLAQVRHQIIPSKLPKSHLQVPIAHHQDGKQ